MFPDYLDGAYFYEPEEPEQEEKKPTTIEDVEVSILEYYDSATKQIETLYAQYLLSKALPNGFGSMFSNMFGTYFGGSLKDVEDVVYQGHTAFKTIFSKPELLIYIPRSLQLKIVRKYMNLLRSASIMKE